MLNCLRERKTKLATKNCQQEGDKFFNREIWRFVYFFIGLSC